MALIVFCLHMPCHAAEWSRAFRNSLISTELRRWHGKFQLLLSSYLHPQSDSCGAFFHSRSLTKVSMQLARQTWEAISLAPWNGRKPPMASGGSALTKITLNRV
jgi:hypothetical protein